MIYSSSSDFCNDEAPNLEDSCSAANDIYDLEETSGEVFQATDNGKLFLRNLASFLFEIAV